VMHNMTTATVSLHVVVTTGLTAAACGLGHISIGGLVSGHPVDRVAAAVSSQPTNATRFWVSASVSLR
jgi:hypothetical protein